MPDDTAPPMPVWSVKFFRDLRSLTPTRLAYISRTSEAEVVQRAAECMADEEAARAEISSFSTRRSWQTARSIGSIERPAHLRGGTMSPAPTDIRGAAPASSAPVAVPAG